AGVQERIARIAEPGDVEMRRLVLVVDADIDVADTDGIAAVLRGAIGSLVEHGDFPSRPNIRACSAKVETGFANRAGSNKRCCAAGCAFNRVQLGVKTATA